MDGNDGLYGRRWCPVVGCWLGWWWDADCLGHRGGCVSSGCVVSVEVSEEGSVGGGLVGELAWRIPKGGRMSVVGARARSPAPLLC